MNLDAVPNAAADKAEFYDWKWGQASTADGQTTVGLGTDIGPEAICYRQDLLEKAGLPTDPATLATQVGDVGRLHRLRQAVRGLDHQAGRLALRRQRRQHLLHRRLPGRPGLRRRRRQARRREQRRREERLGLRQPGRRRTSITAGLAQFTDAWNKAFSSGAFAALACPTWMMGYIQGQAGDAYAGKWDIAPVLPGGATNWGGSWLGVPTDGRAQVDAAIALVEWLSAKEQQVTMWTSAAGRALPVQLQAAAPTRRWRAPRAPTSATRRWARSSAASPTKMKIPPIGLYDTQIQHAFTDAADQRRDQGHGAGQRVHRRARGDQADHRLTIAVVAVPGACPRPARTGTRRPGRRTRMTASSTGASMPRPLQAARAPTSPPAPTAAPAARPRVRCPAAGCGYAYVAAVLRRLRRLQPLPVARHGVGLAARRAACRRTTSRSWLGLDNYRNLFTNEFFWNAFRNTITIGILSTVPQLCMALGIAHLLNYRLRGRTFFRVAMLMPYATSLAAATVIFVELFGRDSASSTGSCTPLHLPTVDWQGSKWPSPDRGRRRSSPGAGPATTR